MVLTIMQVQDTNRISYYLYHLDYDINNIVQKIFTEIREWLLRQTQHCHSIQDSIQLDHTLNLIKAFPWKERLSILRNHRDDECDDALSFA